jgi:L-aspartate oxidase
VWTDLEGRTNVERLFAAGEVACTGVHGANRLASNSLLEGVVFGARAGRAMREARDSHVAFHCGEVIYRGPLQAALAGESACPTQRIAWEKCGIVRDAAGLREACRLLEPHTGENAALVALLIARCALAREESRGAHFRTDYPEKRAEFARHSVVGKNADVTFR